MSSVEQFVKDINKKWWNGEVLGDIISFDTETRFIEGPDDIPPVVITTVYDGGNTAYWLKNQDASRFYEIHKNREFIAHNFEFDCTVTEKEGWFNFHNLIVQDKIHCTWLGEQLIKLAVTGKVPMGKYTGLAYLIKREFNIELSKDENIRHNFGDFILDNGSINYDSMDKSSLDYAINDTIYTYLLYKKQIEKFNKLDTDNRSTMRIQIMGHIGLQAIARNGIGFDLQRKEDKLRELKEAQEERASYLKSFGWQKGNGSNEALEKIFTENLKIAIPLPAKKRRQIGRIRKYGKNHINKKKGNRCIKLCNDYVKRYNNALPEGILKLTEAGRLPTADKDLNFYRYHKFINTYLDFKENEKLLTFFDNINVDRVNPQYKPLLNTGRTSCYRGRYEGVNIQQLPRKGGVREMFVPKKGHTFAIIDYSSIEMATVAQVCYSKYGESVLRKFVNSGKDVHVQTASKMYTKNESECGKGTEERQFSKVANFGFLANMGAETFRSYAAPMGITVNSGEAKNLKNLWASVYPIIQKYFWKDVRPGEAVKTLTGRLRGNCTYTQYLNTQFQGLAADGAKLALYFCHRAGYKMSAFIHDEIVFEVPEESAKEALQHCSEIMVEAMKFVCPDLEIAVEGHIEKQFCK